MPKSRLEGKVGLFVFIGLVLLAVLLIQFSKGTTFFRSTYDILLRTSNVGGLKKQAIVLMSGVQVGTVSDIRLALHGTNVIITLRIYREYEIHKDARFALEQSGFLGDQYVAVMPTRNALPPFKNGDVAVAEAPFNLQEAARAAAGFIRRIDQTAQNLDEAIAQVRRDVLNEHTLTNLSATVINARLLSEHALVTVDDLSSVVASNSPTVTLSVSNLYRASDRLNELAGALGSLVSSNRPDVNAAVSNLEASTVTLKNLLDEVQAGKGLAGALLKNEQIATNVAQIAYNLSITTSNLNRRGLWGVLWSHKPPAPKPPPAPLRAPKYLND